MHILVVILLKVCAIDRQRHGSPLLKQPVPYLPDFSKRSFETSKNAEEARRNHHQNGYGGMRAQSYSWLSNKLIYTVDKQGKRPALLTNFGI
jgi:hypothetical protein